MYREKLKTIKTVSLCPSKGSLRQFDGLAYCLVDHKVRPTVMLVRDCLKCKCLPRMSTKTPLVVSTRPNRSPQDSTWTPHISPEVCTGLQISPHFSTRSHKDSTSLPISPFGGIHSHSGLHRCLHTTQRVPGHLPVTYCWKLEVVVYCRHFLKPYLKRKHKDKVMASSLALEGFLC